MEESVGLETTLFGGPPEIGNLRKLANSQIGFMNIFAYPLFEAVADILPPMTFAGEEIRANQAVWKQKIEEEKSKEDQRLEVERYSREGFQSPRSGSPDRLFASSAEQSHPEGLPASGERPEPPASIPMSTSQGTLDSLRTMHRSSLPNMRSKNSTSANFAAFSHNAGMNSSHRSPALISSPAVSNLQSVRLLPSPLLPEESN